MTFLPRMRMASADPTAPRGVYFLPWTGSGGERYLAAVDRWGRRIIEAVIYPGADPRPIERILWDLLDREDPPLPGSLSVID